tara:strand:+ start:5702 stop:5842 length:141 start_codon:yes stop_codon:yes gene_type:complete
MVFYSAVKNNLLHLLKSYKTINNMSFFAKILNQKDAIASKSITIIS